MQFFHRGWQWPVDYHFNLGWINVNSFTKNSMARIIDGGITDFTFSHLGKQLMRVKQSEDGSQILNVGLLIRTVNKYIIEEN